MKYHAAKVLQHKSHQNTFSIVGNIRHPSRAANDNEAGDLNNLTYLGASEEIEKVLCKQATAKF
jgi:hypothetical protein